MSRIKSFVYAKRKLYFSFLLAITLNLTWVMKTFYIFWIIHKIRNWKHLGSNRHLKNDSIKTEQFPVMPYAKNQRSIANSRNTTLKERYYFILSEVHMYYVTILSKCVVYSIFLACPEDGDVAFWWGAALFSFHLRFFDYS